MQQLSQRDNLRGLNKNCPRLASIVSFLSNFSHRDHDLAHEKIQYIPSRLPSEILKMNDAQVQQKDVNLLSNLQQEHGAGAQGESNHSIPMNEEQIRQKARHIGTISIGSDEISSHSGKKRRKSGQSWVRHTSERNLMKQLFRIEQSATDEASPVQKEEKKTKEQKKDLEYIEEKPKIKTEEEEKTRDQKAIRKTPAKQSIKKEPVENNLEEDEEEIEADTQDWAQCEGCKKWRKVFTIPKGTFLCEDALKKCDQDEDYYDTESNEVLTQEETHLSSLDAPGASDSDTEDGDNMPGGWYHTREKLSRAGLSLEECKDMELEASQVFLENAKEYIRDKSRQVMRRLGTWNKDLQDNFTLPSDIAPDYGHKVKRLAYLSRKKFRVSEGGIEIRKGRIRLTEEEAERCGLPSPWLRSIFTANKEDQGSYVFHFDGVEVPKTKVERNNAKADQSASSKAQDSAGGKRKSMNQGEGAGIKRTMHVLMIGRKYIDASDTKRFPNGLLNTNPGGPNSCFFGKHHEQCQKNAPKRTARNVFLKRDCARHTLLTAYFGRDFCTKGFVKLNLEPKAEKGFSTYRSCRESSAQGSSKGRGKPKVSKRRKTEESRRRKKENQEKTDFMLARRMALGRSTRSTGIVPSESTVGGAGTGQKKKSRVGSKNKARRRSRR